MCITVGLVLLVVAVVAGAVIWMTVPRTLMCLSWFLKCETAALRGLSDAQSCFVTSDPLTPLSAAGCECICASISITRNLSHQNL
ncbi:hypothetical protein JEQ12_010561 [Ovis aries]|uniref:Uncharacterized protein n=1 Tax=Ovis aries TaxID=9940 RepID=A0A835ZWC8_SHEEP|nr:hypothetical protein JEQ12_010561 [Ovis aries]